MTGGTDGWTIETLRAHLEALARETDHRYEDRFQAQEKAVVAALASAKEAVAKAEIASEKRLDLLNEFRGQLGDQATTFMPRIEAEQRMAAFAEKFADSDRRHSDRLSALESRQDRNEGRSKGLDASWGYLIGAVMLVGAVIAIVVVFVPVING